MAARSLSLKEGLWDKHTQLSSVFQASYPCGLGMFSKNMYAPLIGSDKGGRANVNGDERVNHTECMKVLAGVLLREEGKEKDGGMERLSNYM